MDHIIWLTNAADKAIYLMANSIIYFSRHDENFTMVHLNNGSCLLVKSKPEEIQSRLNYYQNEMLDFLTRPKNGL